MSLDHPLFTENAFNLLMQIVNMPKNVIFVKLILLKDETIILLWLTLLRQWIKTDLDR
jgi:hypothetical protein